MFLSPGTYLNTSYYSFHKLGAYSINDLYFDYGNAKYDFRMAIEKRQHDSGIKSFGIQINSVFNNSTLIIGDRPYQINAPLSTTMSLRGITLLNNNMDFFIAKTKDPISSLPPTFNDNKFLVGCKFRTNISNGVPLDFFISRKNDKQNNSGILKNSSFGTNASIKLRENILFSSQLWSSYSDIGFGSSFSLNSSYVNKKIAAHAYYRKVFDKYVTPSNILALPGDWTRITLYEKPANWIDFSQNITYSSFSDLRLGLNTTLTVIPWPYFGYGISLSRKTETIAQNIHSGWRYKKFRISGDYSWSRDQNGYGIKIEQGIKNLRIWSSLQIRDATILQFGGTLPFSKSMRLKSFLKLVTKNDQSTQSTGAQLSLKFLRSFSLNYTYEMVHYNSINDHVMSLSISNTVLLDETGFSFIHGKVFMDLNNNGFCDIEDQVVPNVQVILDGKEETKTDNKGNYSFSFVKSGKHMITLNLGCIPADIGTTKKQYAVDTKFLSKTKVNIPLGELGSIEAVIFYDENNNGKMDKDEKGVPNAVLGLNGFLTTTDSEGKFRFSNLVSGTYRLEVKIIPPKTTLMVPEMTYIHIEPGEKFSGYEMAITKEKRSIKKQIFK